MKKEIEFSSKFDTTEFDRSVDYMQKKLKEIYAPVDMARQQNQTATQLNKTGINGTMSAPTQDAFSRASMQARRELEEFLKRESTATEKINKMYNERVSKLRELREAQAGVVKGSQEELDLKNKIARVEENNLKIKEAYDQRTETLRKGIEIRNSNGGAGGKPPGLGSGNDDDGEDKSEGRMKATAKITGAFASLMLGLSKVVKTLGEQQNDIQSSSGNATQNTYGREVSNIYGRSTGSEQMFMTEKQAAMDDAMASMKATRKSDQLKLIGAGSLVAGGAITAGVGGFTPPALVAGGLMAAGGVASVVSSKRLTNAFLADGGDAKSKAAYEGQLFEEASGEYSKNYEDRKNQNPFKTQATNEYMQNLMPRLDFQRKMGMNDSSFYGGGGQTGFMRQGTDNGFTPEMMMGMASGIQGAGGSTRSSQQNSLFGLQLQRNMGLTNAGSVLGKLSGSIGDSQATKQATIGILAEGMKLGLDDSKFAEENRKFTQAAADAVAKSGARNGDDIERIAAQFARFQGDKTSQGIEAGKNAYEKFQQDSSAITGPKGVMRMAGFRKDPLLSQLSTVDQMGLSQVPDADLNADNPLLQGAAKKLNVSPDELYKNISGINDQSRNRLKSSDVLRDRLRKALNGSGESSITRDNLNKFPASVQQDYMDFTTQDAAVNGYQSTADSYATATGAVGMKQIPQYVKSPDYGKRVQDKIDQGANTGKTADQSVASMAADAGAVLTQFNGMRDSLKSAAETASKYSDSVRSVNAAMMELFEAVRSGKMSSDDAFKQFRAQQSAVQNQAGKKGNP